MPTSRDQRYFILDCLTHNNTNFGYCVGRKCRVIILVLATKRLIKTTMDEEILTNLKILIKLTAISVTKDFSFREKVEVLSSVGISSREIAGILNKTPNHISVTLAELKRSKKNE